jgi:hypothetical protein
MQVSKSLRFFRSFRSFEKRSVIKHESLKEDIDMRRFIYISLAGIAGAIIGYYSSCAGSSI